MIDLQLGKKIKHLRELKNYSREYLSDRAGLSIKSLSNIENDTSDPSINTLYNIAKVLETNLETILNFNEKIFFNTGHDESQWHQHYYKGQSHEPDYFIKLIQEQHKTIEKLSKVIDTLNIQLNK